MACFCDGSLKLYTSLTLRALSRPPFYIKRPASPNDAGVPTLPPTARIIAAIVSAAIPMQPILVAPAVVNAPVVHRALFIQASARIVRSYLLSLRCLRNRYYPQTPQRCLRSTGLFSHWKLAVAPYRLFVPVF